MVALKLVMNNLFHLRRRRTKCQPFERTGLRNQPQGQRQHARTYAGPFIFRAPFFFIARTREIEKEFLFRHAGNFLHDLIFFQLPRHVGHIRDDRAGRIAERAQCQIQMAAKQIFQFKTVSILERAFQYRLSHFESDECTKRARRIASLRNLKHIETEFSPDM